jgi:hypothetical protein
MSSSRFITLCMLLGALIFGWTKLRDIGSPTRPAETPGVIVDKQPVNFAKRTFDPNNPPAAMPPLNAGENAECDSDFRSNASIRGQILRANFNHATLTVTQVKVTLQLNIVIWVPTDVTQHVLDHEEGHRQIAESYYQTANQVAERIAATYLGRQVEITGSDLNAESGKALQQMAAEITDEYGKELNSEPTQLLYDDITDHSRNGVVAADAVAHVLQNAGIESPVPSRNSR